MLDCSLATSSQPLGARARRGKTATQIQTIHILSHSHDDVLSSVDLGEFTEAYCAVRVVVDFIDESDRGRMWARRLLLTQLASVVIVESWLLPRKINEWLQICDIWKIPPGRVETASPTELCDLTVHSRGWCVITGPQKVVDVLTDLHHRFAEWMSWGLHVVLAGKRKIIVLVVQHDNNLISDNFTPRPLQCWQFTEQEKIVDHSTMVYWRT